MIKIKQLSEKFWILNVAETGAIAGMVNLTNKNLYHIAGPKNTLVGNDFPSLELLVTNYFNDKILEVNEDEKSEVIPLVREINGFPTEHTNPLICEPETINGRIVETYKLTEKGTLRYTAGWYGIKTALGITFALSPTTKLLRDNEFIGPYNSEIDLKFESQKFKRG